MNHQPFESWLLDDKHLSANEKRELDAHVRTCRYCSALAETGLALRSTSVVSPAAGFTARFQSRLTAHKIAERRRRLWGLILLAVTGAILLGILAAPLIKTFVSSPVEWFTALTSYFLYVYTSFQAFGDIASVLARMAPNFIPTYGWMVMLSTVAGLGLIWIISIWRFSNKPQGVSL